MTSENDIINVSKTGKTEEEEEEETADENERSTII